MFDGATKGLVYFMKRYIRIASGALSLLSLLACAAILSVFVVRTYRHDADPHVDPKRLAASGVSSIKNIDTLLATTEVLSNSVCIQTAIAAYYCKIDASAPGRDDFTSHGYNVVVRRGMAFWYDSGGSLRLTSRY